MSALLSLALPTQNQTAPYVVGGLPGALRAWLAIDAARKSGAPVLVVTASQGEADQIETELAAIAPADTEVLHFPDWETLAYDNFSPHQDIISERLRVLAQLPTLGQGVVVVAAQSLLQRLPPVEYVNARSLALAKGETIDREQLVERLIEVGYLRVPEVGEHGEIAIRGSIVDIFPMGSELPLRIDFFDNDIETIRTFDPDTQLSGEEVERIDVLPGREIPLDPPIIKAFRGRYRERFSGQASQSPVYRDVSEGISHGGIEYYLPLFFDATANLIDYLPGAALLQLDSDIELGLETAFQAIQERHDVVSLDPDRALLKPAEAFFEPADVTDRWRRHLRIQTQSGKPVKGTDAGGRVLPPLPRQTIAKSLRDVLDKHNGRVLYSAESAGRREALHDFLRDHNLAPRRFDSLHEFLASDAEAGLIVAPFAEGFYLPQRQLLLIPEQELFGSRLRARRKRRRGARDPQALISELSDLTRGAPVVHDEYGVGRFIELATLTIGGISSEFLTLEYAGGDKLYVPVHSLHLISRYTGSSPESAPLHRLGSDQWAKARKRAAEKARDVAAELLDIYARRAARQGHAFHYTEANYRQFESQFAYEPTEDQERVIEEVIADMRAPQPMDRVVCGDVGFGKTEVALRAAFVAVEGGKQVAMLVPTTLLASQHHETFSDRFADWPINVELLSRFRSAKEARDVLQGLKDGKVDIVIGTHKLLNHSDAFSDVGLIIVDEEHRFGVRQKDRIKSLRAEVDILTLTATPIPRTLNMALGGLRELSLITTPPSNRLSIKTFVSQWNDGLIREAVQRELRRGGQVYFVHNEVQGIEKVAQQLANLIPEARIEVGHGQMRETELEAVMADFYHRRFNVLLCTTIIESGIDVPSANTIIINRADRFGLAQLHQMRGRVGRSHHRAYAYLLAPPKAAMTADAHKRLQAIESLEDLGAGFALASHDLEIRGAGELLGDEQSGQIQEVGFSLYTELLASAVDSLKNGKEPDFDKPLNSGPEVNLHEPALLPADYVADVHLRLVLYKRIASAANQNALLELKVELVDRFGLLPPPAERLLSVTELKILAESIGVIKIDVGPSNGRIQFAADATVDPAKLIQLVQSGTGFRMRDATRLTFTLDQADFTGRALATREMLQSLGAGQDA